MKLANKTALALLTAFLISTAVFVPLNTGTQALLTDDPPSLRTYAISDAIPDIIGLGEETLLKCGITEALASQAYGWTDITIVVSHPDGHNETLGPFTTDSTGSHQTKSAPTL